MRAEQARVEGAQRHAIGEEHIGGVFGLLRRPVGANVRHEIAQERILLPGESLQEVGHAPVGIIFPAGRRRADRGRRGFVFLAVSPGGMLGAARGV